MRKLILTLLIAISATSCYVDSYWKPQKTERAYYQYFPIEYRIRAAASITNISLRVNEWLHATDAERTKIEDKYFYDCKLRLVADTVKLRVLSNYWLEDVSVITLNTDITAATASWKVINHQTRDTIYITCTDIDRWTLTSHAGHTLYDTRVQQQSATDGISTFIVDGGGIASDSYRRIAFTAASPLEVTFDKKIIYPNSDCRIESGIVEFCYEDDTETLVRVETLEYQLLKVTFHGFTDVYDYRYYLRDE